MNYSKAAKAGYISRIFTERVTKAIGKLGYFIIAGILGSIIIFIISFLYKRKD